MVIDAGGNQAHRHLYYGVIVIITHKIRSLKDQTLDTIVDHKQLVVGEVASVKFLSQAQMMSFVGMGVFELAPDIEPIRKIIPVIGVPRLVDEVMTREIEVPLVFDPGFILETHLVNG